MQNSAELLIDLDDIRSYVPMAKNANTDNRILPHIIEAQQFDVAEWIGNDFYYDIWNNKAVYTDLLNGGSYVYEGKTYQFYGLKPFICLMAAVRIIQENDISVTATGNVIKDTEQSTQALHAERINKLRTISNRAMAYKDNISLYLCRKRSLYPLYTRCNDNKAVEDKTLQLFTGVGKYGNQKF